MKMFQDCCIGGNKKQESYRSSQKLKQQLTSNLSPNHSKTSTNHHSQDHTDTHADTPLKVKLIDSFGLRDFLVDSMIFARRKSNYKFQTIQGKKQFIFKSIEFQPIPGYQQICDVIQQEGTFVPLIHFRKKKDFSNLKQGNYNQSSLISSDLTMIYSHGNSSDLQHSYQIVQLMIKKYPSNYIIYDYTGYGNQCAEKKLFREKEHKLSDKSICSDLRKVIQWSGLPLEKIVLWGFSLGCHPSISIATELKVNNLILQSPFASIFHLLQDEPQAQNIFKEDIFNNLSLISHINCNALLIHSEQDEMIPIRHSRMLLNKFNNSRNDNEMRLIEICNLKHNEMNAVFCVRKRNQLQAELGKYLVECSRQKHSKRISRSRKLPQKDRESYMSISEVDGSRGSLVSDRLYIPQHLLKHQKRINVRKQTRSTEQNQILNQIERNQIKQDHLKMKINNSIEFHEDSFYEKKHKYSFSIQ